MKVTWEPAHNLPKSVIEEFERGDEVIVEDKMEYKYGKKTHTATVVSRTWSEDKGSTLKKLKLSQHQAPQNTG